MYETFDHTADLGLRIREGDLNGLFATAAEALFSVIMANPDSVRTVESVSFAIEGNRPDDLLFDWLAELLWTFDTRSLVFGSFEVDVRDDGLTGKASGEPVDHRRHELVGEVKAITYHGLTVRRDGQGWLAEVIIDI